MPAYAFAGQGNTAGEEEYPLGVGVEVEVEAPEQASVTEAAGVPTLLSDLGPITPRTSSATTIDLTDTSTTAGANWEYAAGVFTVKDGANVTITGTTDTNRVVVASGATAIVRLNNAHIDVSSISHACAFDASGATLTLILETTNELKSNGYAAGLQAPQGSTLTITSASGNGSANGSLTATGGAGLDTGLRWSAGGAGIGGGDGFYVPAAGIGGSITINGGTVTAIGTGYGAGIGGGNTAPGGITIINGGVVVAEGNGGISGAAGIGGGGSNGQQGAQGGIVTINGGTVTATANGSGAGIGSGNNGGANGGQGGLITINGGSVTAFGASAGAGIGGGAYSSAEHIVITGGTVRAINGDTQAGTRGSGAGIGGGGGLSSALPGGSGGLIEISGGVVYASSGAAMGMPAAIGGGGGVQLSGGGAGTISITGGTVVAVPGDSGAAALGGGNDAMGGSLALSGGTVYAGGRGIGIGGGTSETATTVTGTPVILATGILSGSSIAPTATVASGLSNITIAASGTSPALATAGTVTLNRTVTEILGGCALTVPTGWTLDVNNNTLTDTGAVISYGQVVNWDTPLYLANCAVVDSGVASGSTIAATYYNTPLSSGAFLSAGKQLVITVTGAGAPSGAYTYVWSGTAAGMAITGETTNTFTVNNLAAAVDATCTVTDATALGASITTPATEASKTHDSLTVTPAQASTNPGSQDIEYYCSTSNVAPAPLVTWVSNLTFSGLSADTTYYVWARTAAKTGYGAGTPASSAPITTFADKTTLIAKAAEAALLTQGANTTATWTDFAAALAGANTVIANASATQTEVDSARSALSSALGALKANDYSKEWLGALSTFTKGSTTTLTLVSAHDYALFAASVSVDGTTLVEGTHYTTASGSTRVTLLSSYLERLAAGSHTITVSFTGSIPDISDAFSVLASGTPQQPGSGIPGTGDDPALPLTATLLALAGLAFIAYLWQRRCSARRTADATRR